MDEPPGKIDRAVPLPRTERKRERVREDGRHILLFSQSRDIIAFRRENRSDRSEESRQGIEERNYRSDPSWKAVFVYR